MIIRIHFEGCDDCTVIEHQSGSMAHFLDLLESTDYIRYYTIDGRNPITPNRWHKWKQST